MPLSHILTLRHRHLDTLHISTVLQKVQIGTTEPKVRQFEHNHLYQSTKTKVHYSRHNQEVSQSEEDKGEK